MNNSWNLARFHRYVAFYEEINTLLQFTVAECLNMQLLVAQSPAIHVSLLLTESQRFSRSCERALTACRCCHCYINHYLNMTHFVYLYDRQLALAYSSHFNGKQLCLCDVGVPTLFYGENIFLNLLGKLSAVSRLSGSCTCQFCLIVSAKSVNVYICTYLVAFTTRQKCR